MSEISQLIRTEFKKSDDVRDAGLETPEDIIRYDNLVYGENPDWQVLDVYRPKKLQNQKLPVIVSVHGGGWVYGDKERYQYYCMSLAQNGFAVVNYTYRLAPEFQFPAGIEDENLVFDWVLRYAEQYGFDTDAVFAVGDSAGAHQLGIYANILTNPEYAKSYPVTVPEGLKLKGIALNCGMYDFDGINKNDQQTTLLMNDLLPEHGTDEELEQISVLKHITGAFPPVFLMSATGDFLLVQTPGMIKTLTENQVPFEYHFYGDRQHQLGHVFHCNMKLPEAYRCNRDECDFFRRQMDQSFTTPLTGGEHQPSVNESEIRNKYRMLTEYLIRQHMTITTMESATSGQVASLITDTEGASAVMKGAFITYSNEAKIQCGVPKNVIEQYSVYSEQTAEAMAAAAKKAYHADLAVGVTGTFGNIDPDNAAASEPGVVYLAVATDTETRTAVIHLEPQSSRLQYKLLVADHVYLILSQMLKIQ